MNSIHIATHSKSTNHFALFELGFRPFFLLGSVYALLSIFAWALALHGFNYNPQISGLWWHSHEMIFGFGMAIVMGFLLTATQNWTGISSIRGAWLMLVVGLWGLPRIALTFQAIPFVVSMLSDLSSNLIVSFLLAHMLIKAKKWNNLPLVAVLLVLTTLNALSYWFAAKNQAFLMTRIHESTLFWFAILINILGGRVIPFFTERATSFKRGPEAKWVLSISSLSLIALSISALFENELFFRANATICAILVFYRLCHWGWSKTWGTPLLWSLHLSFAFLPLACALIALGYPRSGALHVLTIGAITGIIVAMMSRVSLGHTGRVLKTKPLMSWAFVMFEIAAICRFCAPLSVRHYLTFIDVSVLLWLISFSIFISHYGLILIQPRADGQKG